MVTDPPRMGGEENFVSTNDGGRDPPQGPPAHEASTTLLPPMPSGVNAWCYSHKISSSTTPSSSAAATSNSSVKCEPRVKSSTK